jgi:polar amino acid transport system substrate-binding protein
MTKKLATLLVSLLLLTLLPYKAWAETLLEKIARTGELTVGSRQDAVPFGFRDKNQKLVGYSVELMHLIHQQIESQTKKPVQLNIVEVNVENRFDKVVNREVDLVCGATTITAERLEKVDFSVPFFMTGSQFLTQYSEANKFDINTNLKGVPIAYIPNTTSDFLVRQIYPQANWQPVANRAEGIEKLTSGQVKALISDGVLLVGEVVRMNKDPWDFALTPSQPITTELYGCILPKNEADFQNLVNAVILSDANIKLQETWFNIDAGPYPYRVRLVP